MPDFKVISKMKPQGDQPAAIDKLVENFRRGQKHNVLLGVTGSGKTFTMAHTIERLQKPALIISHNKTLAAQLYEEMKELFPENAVEYFVSYYDYYQPEAYIPQRDIYIEKDSSKNDDLDRLRLSATTSLSARRDVVIVASVSCIFGLGSPEEYKKMVVPVRRGMETPRDELLRGLVNLQYERNDVNFKRGTFRVRGDTVDIYPAYEQFGYQVEMFGDQVEAIRLINPTTGEALSDTDQAFIFPAVHYVADGETIERAVRTIREELEARLIVLKNEGKLLEAQRLAARTKYDIEMMLEVGYCSGIENYSRHLDGRAPGQKPYTLIDYFGGDFLLIIDESHVTLPQLHAMYNGDRHRKETLVEYGFRLPSALDNRPLKYEEFQDMWKQVMFVSATPGKHEIEAGGEVVEQIIRPKGLVDPPVEVRPAARAGGRPAGGDRQARIGRRTDADYHAHQAAFRGPRRVRPQRGLPLQVPAQRDRNARPRGHPARPAQGQVRRADRREPASRGAGPAGGQPRGDPQRGQAGLPAIRDQPRPNDRPGAEMSTPPLSSTPTRSPRPCRRRSPPRFRGERCNSNTIASTASRRPRSSRRSAPPWPTNSAPQGRHGRHQRERPGIRPHRVDHQAGGPDARGRRGPAVRAGRPPPRPHQGTQARRGNRNAARNARAGKK